MEMHKDGRGDDESKVSKIKVTHGTTSQVSLRYFWVRSREELQRLMGDIG